MCIILAGKGTGTGTAVENAAPASTAARLGSVMPLLLHLLTEFGAALFTPLPKP